MDTICIPEKGHKILHGRCVHVDETLTDLQILGCELHQNAFGGRAPPGPVGRAIVLPQTPLPIVGEGKGKKRVGNTEGGKGG